MENTNSTLNIIDLSINKSIDFIASAVRQLFQLIFCLLSILVLGKLVKLFMSKEPPVEVQNEPMKQEISETEQDVQGKVEKESVKELSGWDSESINDVSTPSFEIPSSNVTAKAIKKQLKKKSMSIGPIMLTSNSQIVRTLNHEEGEERFRYDVLPLDTTLKTSCVDSMCVYHAVFPFALTCFQVKAAG